MDVDAIEAGRDFRKAIDQSVASCSVLLAVIGQEWLEPRAAAGLRRLDEPNDFLRIELVSALRRDIPVVPVLVRGAKMPQAEQLPDDLKELAYRNAMELTHARWKSDVQVLIRALRPYLDTPGASTSPVTRIDEREQAGGPREVVSGQAAGGQRPDASAVASTFEPQIIQRVSTELAAYIGPIAEVVVKRAARQCSSPEDLYVIVAREIETEADRLKFLKSCRSHAG